MLSVLKGGGYYQTGWLAAHQPAIDWDHHTGHIVRKIGRKELDDLRAILDRPEPSRRLTRLGRDCSECFGKMAVAMTRPVAITP